MTRERWRDVKAITADALGLAEHERAVFIASRCGADQALCREVQSLVAAALKATDLFERPVISTAGLHAVLTEAELAVGSFVGRRVGAYQLVAEIGRGGMGTAYLAERVDAAFEKRVAIKLIKRGMDSDAILRRFLHERQILATLDHPNIARLLDGGATDDGLPYFIMEYVDGLRIDVYCDSNQLSVSDRLNLFLGVCAAVDHAHQNRIAHRDLKPANVVVTRGGVPKLLDFGIAKLLDPESALLTNTATGLLRPMTPEYASPEQIRGEAVGTSSDIYSLGVLLYELLTGRNPQSSMGRTPQETERSICEEVPQPPSTGVDPDAAMRRRSAPEALRRRLAGDLDTIVLTALHKDPARRYHSVQLLADDIRRHLNGDRILARPESTAARALRQLRERRHLVAAAALGITALLVLGVYSISTSRRADQPVISSIAVLPFASSQPGGDLDYLTEGMTENVIRRLSRASGLKVIARDSVYGYAGGKSDPRQAGRDLGVEAVLTGRMTRQGAALVIDAELVDVRDGSRLWGDRFERPLADVQFVQAELSQQIASRLRLRFTPSQRQRLAQSGAASPEAYQLYLRGLYFWNKRTAVDLRKSVSYFNQAVQREPSFAAAYAGLADAYGLLTEYHAVPARDTYALAKAAAERALALDDGLAEAHGSSAYIKQFYEWDWAGAEAEFKRALELDPGYATVHQWYAEYLSAMGRHDEALTEIRRAAEVDPLSLIVNSVQASLLYFARRYDDAIDACHRVIEMDGNFPEVFEYLKRAYDQKGLYADSIAARQTRRRLVGLNADLTPALRVAANATSPREYWTARLQQELAESKAEGLRPFEMAEIVGQAGDPSHALDWLERACSDNDFMIMTIRVAPNLDPLRSTARFRALLARTCRVGP